MEEVRQTDRHFPPLDRIRQAVQEAAFVDGGVLLAISNEMGLSSSIECRAILVLVQFTKMKTLAKCCCLRMRLGRETK